MSKRQILHMLMPAAGAIAAAFLIELGAQTTGWAAAWTYVFAGLVVGCLVIIGVPFALGYRFSIEPIEIADLPPPDADLVVVGLGGLTTSVSSFGAAARDVRSDFVLNLANPITKPASYVSIDPEWFTQSWLPIVRTYGEGVVWPSQLKLEDVVINYDWDSYLANLQSEKKDVPIVEPEEVVIAKPSSWRPVPERFVVPELAGTLQPA